MAITQSDLDALDRAIVSGVLEVEFEGMRRRFRSMSELMQAREHAAGILNGAGNASGAGRPAVAYQFGFATSRGD